ncbi:MAG: glycine oxidase ThiO [Acidobacteria bacterium]|nr:glycine oxidase ThiO [Acidobacteriota bacterium]
MKTWDAIIIGAGIIGLTLAIELRKQGLRVMVVDKGEPGRESSWAAGGMLVDFSPEMPRALQELGAASARMYPEFVHQLKDESRLNIDLRSEGALLWDPASDPLLRSSYPLPAPLAELEPHLAAKSCEPFFVRERCVDPRDLVAAVIATARHREVDFSSGDTVLGVEINEGKAIGVRTNKTTFAAGAIVNCAGAWAGQVAPHVFPTRPVKGQMLYVVMPEKDLLRHVVRTPEVYLIPRSDGRLLIGATVEEAGFDKQVVPDTIHKLRKAAIEMVPRLTEARILESWAGLRPGTPDALPILGATSTPGYFVATGHFRDGILLAPITANLMTSVVTGRKTALDLSAFSPARFS